MVFYFIVFSNSLSVTPVCVGASPIFTWGRLQSTKDFASVTSRKERGIVIGWAQEGGRTSYGWLYKTPTGWSFSVESSILGPLNGTNLIKNGAEENLWDLDEQFGRLVNQTSTISGIKQKQFFISESKLSPSRFQRNSWSPALTPTVSTPPVKLSMAMERTSLGVKLSLVSRYVSNGTAAGVNQTRFLSAYLYSALG